MVIHDDWMMWGYPHDFGNLHIIHISSVFIIMMGQNFSPRKNQRFEYMEVSYKSWGISESSIFIGFPKNQMIWKAHESSTSVDPKDFPWEFRPGAVRTKTSFPAPLGTAGAGAGTAGAADGRRNAGPDLTAFYWVFVCENPTNWVFIGFLFHLILPA
jgi:hypothetical protein